MSDHPGPPSLTPPPLPARPSHHSHASASILDSKRPPRPAQSEKDQWIAAPDPRASSSQSLRSDVSAHDHRRTLLLIYIHGFYGNKQSFRSFPHHVHAYLRSALADSHVIHSKIYPRYKTYRAIELARDNFSEWLIPHESPATDVILVGHSMGGILAAEIVLMPNTHPYRSSQPFKHRVLGTISLDSPFLGLHPGIVVAGISSLFQSAPEAPGQSQDGSGPGEGSSDAPLMRPPNRQQTNDPYYDPPFWNDNPFKEAPFVKRIMNFTKKHRSEGIFNAAANHIVSHLEYGGCLADYPGLHKRYDRIRALEDVDDLEALASPESQGRPGNTPGSCRVRFVNYYTLSSGRPPKPKPDANLQAAGSQPSLAPTPSLQTLSITDSTLSREQSYQTLDSPLVREGSAVSISIEDYSHSKEAVDSKATSTEAKENEKIEHKDVTPETQNRDSIASIATQSDDLSRLSMQDIDPIPMSDSEEPFTPNLNLNLTEGLPPIPDSPTRPPDPDLDQYTDKDARKQVEREHRRQVKNYEKAVKDRNRAIREREKLIEKRRKKAQNQLETDKGKELDMESDRSSISSIKSDELTETQQQQLTALHQQALSTQQERGDSLSLAETASTTSFQPPSLSQVTSATDSQLDGQEAARAKPKKKKKFCTLPSKVNGAKDPTWVDVYMDGMDEVGAHCGLFFSGPHYDKLVGDVASRVIGWVQDDMTKRAILDLHQEDGMP